jgi:hypothetical protein
MLHKTIVEIQTTTGDWAEIAEFGGRDQESTNLRATEWGEKLLSGFLIDRRPRVQIVDGDGNWLGAWFNDDLAQADASLTVTGQARRNAGSES